MRTKKILILGGSHRDIPLIKAAQQLGLHVITIGNGAGYIGHNYADESYIWDFNNLDAISDLIYELGTDYICPGCGEQILINTILLSEKHDIGNFDSLEITMLLHNKAKFKEFCIKNHISTPQGIQINGEFNSCTIDNLNFPLVVKPVNLSGGNGVSIVEDMEGLINAIENARSISSRDDLLIEEFVDGELIAYSVFIKNQKSYIGFAAKDDAYLNNFMVATSYPIELGSVMKAKIDDDINKIATILHLKDGPFHFQILIKNDTPYIIDITRRIPGDLFPFLIEYSTGVEYSKHVINAAIGQEFPSTELMPTKHNYIIRHCLMPKNNGLYKKIYISDEIRNNLIYELYIKQEGEVINNYLKEAIGIVFFRFDTQKEMMKAVRNINTLVYSEVEKNGE